MTRTRRLLVALAMVGTLVSLHADPAGAAFNPVYAYATWGGSCTGDEQFYNPSGWVYMKENGKSGVVQFRAHYRVYRTEVSAGWNRPKLEWTFRTARFPNDATTYADYVPRGGFGWTEVHATSTYRLNVKMTWDRGWRRDWNYTADVAYCR